MCIRDRDIDTPYSAWGFGDAPDQLADLVLKGIKTATASAHDLYFMEGKEEPLPQPGDYSIILDSKEDGYKRQGTACDCLCFLDS